MPETISIEKLTLETLQQLLAVAHRIEGALFGKAIASPSPEPDKEKKTEPVHVPAPAEPKVPPRLRRKTVVPNVPAKQKPVAAAPVTAEQAAVDTFGLGL